MPRARRSRSRYAVEMSRIAFRHIFLPINAIIFSVVVLLTLFGQTEEGLFLGAVVIINIALGFVQDLRAWLVLENLTVLSALYVKRIKSDGSLEQVAVEDVQKGDRIRLSLGDQVPCDGIVEEAVSLEINEGLITGESNSVERATGSEILAGSVVTSGTAVARMETPFSGSRMAQMARGLKRYSANPSPIQVSVQTVIRYTVYVLLATTAFIVVRGILLNETHIRMVEEIGALASILVPQGLVVSTTLLFSFGAGHFFRRNVLLQEVNATEKFGRIKNLCMDKTGTLTENELSVEALLLDPSGGVAESEARILAALYVRYSGDLSQTIRALGAFLGRGDDAKTLDTLSFSSSRRWGGVAIEGSGVIFMGAPEVLAPYMKSAQERAWLERISEEEARKGKHVMCLARSRGTDVPHSLEGAKLDALAVFILANKLREGVRDAVNFFQRRGVAIRILSGDHPATAQTIAKACGVKNTDAVITGAQMANWDAADYARRAREYAIFARIEPEQKEKIIEALKQEGFTAMVGDGANDALSVKKADLGIAMFEGAQATRQVAAVVLMKNSFVELPGGVQLADSMIENIETFASIFLDQTFFAFWLFALLTLLGSNFPLLPLNISFINYFTVGLPGILISYWAITPSASTKPASMRPFLRRVAPLPLWLSPLQALAAVAALALGRLYGLPDSPIALLTLVFAGVGFSYFILAAGFHGSGLRALRWGNIALLAVAELACIIIAFHIPLVVRLFSLSMPSAGGVELAVGIAIVAALVQGAIVKPLSIRTAR